MFENGPAACRTQHKVSKGYKGIGMDFIAPLYAKITQKSINAYRTWAGVASEHATERCSILEIAPGPGYLSMSLQSWAITELLGLISARSL